MQVNPYLFFNGRCEEAIAFYQQAVGAELLFKMTFGEMPAEQQQQEGCASAYQFPPDKIMHAQLKVGNSEIMLSDGDMSSTQQQHAGFAISLAGKDVNEGKSWFDNLAADGNVTMPWQETFWAKGFGMLTDKFGIPWMVNVEKPMK
ncbi:PhnB protein [Erwinia toletana]|uniref:PhnB protein n=1 Tax=Winslowiella toletana TaxID=92490 RepID=A0ABS4P9U3_9GAMM|nr:VOC family metalloprotein YjdN [Winslowiella toletana]MBP2169412.1 PhnB protein [Winslowiella toletana]